MDDIGIVCCIGKNNNEANLWGEVLVVREWRIGESNKSKSVSVEWYEL
jgi:hypothetical protein